MNNPFEAHGPKRRVKVPPLPNQKQPLSNRVKKQLHDTKDSLIKLIKINIATEDYDACIDKLRPPFKEYKPLESTPLLRLQLFTSAQEDRPLEGIALLSNACLLAIEKDGILLEFGELGKDEALFNDSHFLEFRESYPSMSKDIDGLKGIVGLEVGYDELKRAIEKILDEYSNCIMGLEENNDPTLRNISKDTRKGWKKSLLIIIIMIFEGLRFKPLSRAFSLVMTRDTIYEPLIISKWMNFLIHKFRHMTEVAENGDPSKGKVDDDLKWIKEKCNNRDFCEEELGARNQGRILLRWEPIETTTENSETDDDDIMLSFTKPLPWENESLCRQDGSRSETGSSSESGDRSGEEGGNDDDGI